METHEEEAWQQKPSERMITKTTLKEMKRLTPRLTCMKRGYTLAKLPGY